MRRVEDAKFYRGKGGEMMQCAICRLIGAVGQANFSELMSDTIDKLQCTLDQHLKCVTLKVVEAAVVALRQFCSNFYRSVLSVPALGDIEGEAVLVHRLPESYVNILESCVTQPKSWAARDTEAARGYCLGIGALPGHLLRPLAERVLGERNYFNADSHRFLRLSIDMSQLLTDTLAAASRPLDQGQLDAGGSNDADLRRNALLGLGGVVNDSHFVVVRCALFRFSCIPDMLPVYSTGGCRCSAG